MSDLIADIQNSSLWEDVYSVSKDAESVSSVMFRPMDEIVIPFNITSKLVVVYTSCRDAPPSWHSSGWLSQYAATGVTVGGVQNTRVGFSRRCFLDKLILANLENYGQSLRLVFQPHKWLHQISFHIWQFTGSVSNHELEKLDLVRIDLSRIELALKTVVLAGEYNVTLEE